MSYPQPLFVFSLPRSGSTLLQRILAAHSDIATTTETWMLLPYLYTLKSSGIYAEYSHMRLQQAIQDFCKELGGTENYLQEVREMALRLYAKVTINQERYFLEKTPRYHLIVDDIIELFPEGKFIFLWRNPLAVVASLIDTFGRGYWNIRDYKIDLFDGLDCLLRAHQKYGDRVTSVAFEDLLSDPERQCQHLFEYLELPADPGVISRFSEVQLKGVFGDKTGVKQYKSLSKAPAEKWKTTLGNPLRKAWCIEYIHWLGSDRLEVMGYEMQQLLEELKQLPVSANYFKSDLKKMLLDAIFSKLEPAILPKQGKSTSEMRGWQRLSTPHS